MHIRTIEIPLSPLNRGPKPDRQGIKRFWGGLQYENNATLVSFCPNAELRATFPSDALFRIDFNCNGFGYNPSEPLSPDIKNKYSRLIPYDMTVSGKDIEVLFVVSHGESEIIFGNHMIYFDKVTRDQESAEVLYTDISAASYNMNKIYEHTVAISKNVDEKHAEIEQIYKDGTEILQVADDVKQFIESLKIRIDRGDFNGKDGVGIADIYVKDGYLYVRKTDQIEAENIGYVKGNEDSGIKDVKVNEKGELIIILTNNREINIGVINGSGTGTVYTPQISEDKILSWTNNGGLQNPEPVDLNPFDEWSVDGDVESEYTWEEDI